MSSTGGDGPPSRTGPRAVAALAATLFIVATGRALAHPGHDGAVAEPGTWIVYGPVIVGALVAVTAAGLHSDGTLSDRTALVTAAGGLALLAAGLIRWLA